MRSRFNWVVIFCTIGIGILGVMPEAWANDRLEFSTGQPGDWIMQSATIETTPLGKEVVSVRLEEGDVIARLRSSRVVVRPGQGLEVVFDYRTDIADSREHMGCWLYIGWLSDRGQPIGSSHALLPQAQRWVSQQQSFVVPAGAYFADVQFRVQNRMGEADFDKIVVTSGPVRKSIVVESDPETEALGLGLVGSFELEQNAGRWVLAPVRGQSSNGKNRRPLMGQGGVDSGMTFALPAELTNDPDLVYEIEAKVRTRWADREIKRGANALATIGRNVTGRRVKNSMTLTFWGGDQVIFRLLGPQTGGTIYRRSYHVSPKKTVSMKARWGGSEYVLYLDGKKHAESVIDDHWVWPDGKALCVGAEASGQSLLDGKFEHFQLNVYRRALDVRFEGGSQSGYFEGGGEHRWGVRFRRGDPGRVKTTVTLLDEEGGVVHETRGRRRGESHVFDVPPLAYGVYRAQVVAVDGKGLKQTVSRPFMVVKSLPAVVDASESMFGLASGVFSQVPGDRLDAYYRALSRVGIRWARMWVSWDRIESSPGVYNWGMLERNVEAAAKYGIRVLPSLSGGDLEYMPIVPYSEVPVTMSGRGYIKPKNIEDWYRYMGALAEHFRGRITAYQIWNEPDARNSFYPFDPADYLEVLQASHDAIKAQDPEAKVVLGGFAGAFEGFMLNRTEHSMADTLWGAAEFYSHKPQGAFDVVALHLYSLGNPGQSWEPQYASMKRARDFLREHGESDKPMWNTETCFLAGRPGEIGGWAKAKLLAPRDAAARLLQWHTQSKALGFQRNFWYDFPHLFATDLAASPMVCAQVTAALVLDHATGVSEIEMGPNLRAYQMQWQGRQLAIVWAINGTEHVLAEALGGTGGRVGGVGGVELMDMYLNMQETDGGRASFAVTNEPMLVVADGPISLRRPAQITLPTKVVDGQEMTVRVDLSNPSDRATRFAVGVSTGRDQAVEKVRVAAGGEARLMIPVRAGAGALESEIEAEGGLTFRLARSFALEVTRMAEVGSNVGARHRVDQASQVALGGEIIDSQNRVAKESQWHGVEDCSAVFGLRREGSDLVFDVDVTDDVRVPAASDQPLHQGDGVELFFDFRRDAKDMHAVYQVFVSADGRVAGAHRRLPEGFDCRVTQSDKGYRIEGRVALPIATVAGEGMGFDLAVDDADDGNGRKAQIVWAGTSENHRQPDGFGVIRFK